MDKKAIVLFSGGLDSATLLFYAKNKGYVPFCLNFDYDQRNSKEINFAKKIANKYNFEYELIKISLPWKGSSLLDFTKKIPSEDIDPKSTTKDFDINTSKNIKKEIPSTYVPSRNIIFLSFAFSYAEAINAQAVFIGANVLDYSGYPDCRAEFFDAFRQVALQGLKSGIEGKPIEIQTPLLHMTKAEIIKLGLKLKVPYEYTWSCYIDDDKPCLKCESCSLRLRGFKQLGREDPLLTHVT